MNLILDTLYSFLAQLTYAIISLILLEVIVSAIFTIDDRNNITLTFGRIIGDTRYKSSALLVYSIMFIGVAINFADATFQPMIISKILTIGLDTIPLFFASLSFSIFWLTKIFLGRSWKHSMVKMSMTMFALSVSSLIFV